MGVSCKKCPVTAKYGIVGTKTPLFCSFHADKNIHEKVAQNKCELCKKQPIYGVPGGKAIRCSKHHIEGKHVNVINMLHLGKLVQKLLCFVLTTEKNHILT